MNRFFAVSGLALLCIVASQASLSVNYVNSTFVSGTTYQYNYEFQLSPTDELNPPSIIGAQCTTGGNPATACTNTTFATIYDIPNLVATGAPSGWGAATQFLGVTPVNSQGVQESPPNGDSVSLENV